MSATVLQRVVVRMLHDADLRARVYADPDQALAGLDLTPDERALLVRADARAWAVDVHRADRVLTALLAEVPVGAVALRLRGVPLAKLRAFFASATFHDTIMARRSLAPAFADHLASLTAEPRPRALIALERALAVLRRAAATPLPALPPEHLARAAHALPVELPAGTLAAWDRLRKGLGPDPNAALAALVQPKRALGDVLHMIDVRQREWVLFEARAGEPVAGFIGEALGRLLEAAAPSAPRGQLVELARREGADDDAEAIVDELVGDGLLVASVTRP